MAFVFNFPDVGEGIHEGRVVEWLVAEGETVAEDQALLKVETDKAVVELPSPYAGTVLRLHAETDAVIKRLGNAPPKVIVTVGAAATSLVLERIPQTRVIFCLVPNALDMPFMAPDNPHRRRLAASLAAGRRRRLEAQRRRSPIHVPARRRRHARASVGLPSLPATLGQAGRRA